MTVTKKANPQAEKLLLAGFMRNPDAFFDFAQHLTTDDFTTQGGKMTFDAIRSLLIDGDAKTLSRAKLVSEARRLGYQNYLSATKDGESLDEMFAENIPTKEIKRQFLEVKRQAIMRAYVIKTNEVKEYIATTGDDLSTVISNVETMIVSAVSAIDYGETEIKHLPRGLKEFIHGLADQPGHMGLDVGFPVWQSRIGQLRRNSVTFVVATAKAGKSQFGLRAAKHVAQKLRLPVLLVDTELSEEDQKLRLVGMLADVPYTVLETGFWKLDEAKLKAEGLNPAEIQEMMEYGRRMRDQEFWDMAEDLPIHYLSVAGKPLDEVIPHMRRWILTKVKPDPEYKFPQCLIVYDYLKLGSYSELKGGKLQEWQVHGLNYAALHDFTNRYKIPILAFGQTNRSSVEDEDCVAGAKRIIENVDSISILRQKTEFEKALDGKGSHLIKTFLTRHGQGTAGVGGYINVNARLDVGAFEELGLGTVNFEAERQRQMEEYEERKRKRRAKGSGKWNDDDDDD